MSSKFVLPVLPDGLLTRSRLEKAILENRRARLFVLKAPAGFGKSTLGAQALNKVSASRRAWIHLDIFDREPARFIAHTIEGLAKLFPLVRVSDLSGKTAVSVEEAQALAYDTLLLLQEYHGLEGWLALDNWEAVNESKVANAFVKQLIEGESHALKVVLATRKQPAMKLRKLEERGVVEMFDERELGFTLPESNELIGRKLKRQLDEESLERIWRVTKGWCVAATLVARSMDSSDSSRSKDVLEALEQSDSVREYVEEELFSELPDYLMDFVALCSTITTLSSAHCSRLVGDGYDTVKCLEDIKRSTLPLVITGDQMRLHPVVRRVARAQLFKRYPKERVRQCFSTAIEVYCEEGLALEAVELALELPDYQRSLELIDSEWFAIVSSNGLTSLESWLERIPASLRGEPAYVKAKANLWIQQGDNHKLIEFLSHIDYMSAFANDSQQRISLWTRYQWARMNTLDEPMYESIRKEWNRISGEMSSAEDMSLALAGVEVVLCVAAYGEMNIAQAKRHALKALEHVGENGPADYRADILDNLATLEHTIGESPQAMKILERNIEEANARGSTHGAALRMFNLGWINIATGKIRSGLKIIADGRAAIARFEPSNYYAMLFADRYEGIARWLIGEREEGLQLLRRSLEYAERYTPGETEETCALLRYYQSQSGQSKIKHAATLDQVTNSEDGKIEAQLITLACGAYDALASGDIRRARENAQSLGEKSAGFKLRPWYATSALILARVADVEGRTDECAESLEIGLHTLAEIGWALYTLPNNDLTAFVVTRALLNNIHPETAKDLVSHDYSVDLTSAFADALQRTTDDSAARVRLLQAAAELGVRGVRAQAMEIVDSGSEAEKSAACDFIRAIDEMPLPPLRIRSLGRFTVTARNQPIVFSRKKSESMFQMLLTSYPAPLHEEEIVEELWPESEPDKGRGALRTCVKDLRKALDPHYSARGDSYIQYADQRYSLTLSPGSVFDAHEFERAISEWNPGAGGDIKEFERALDMYAGQYLSTARYESFAIEKREELLSLFLRRSAEYCKYLLSCDELEPVFAVLNKGLRFDALWGEGVQLLMEAYARNRELVKAIRLFRAYEKTLDAELGVGPDEELREFFQRIVSQSG